MKHILTPDQLLDLLAVPLEMGGSLYDWQECRACGATSERYGKYADIAHENNCPVGNR